MRTFLTTGAYANQGTRLLTAYVFLVAPWLVIAPGCSSTSEQVNSNVNQGDQQNQNENGSDQPDDNSNSADPLSELEELDGWWVIELTDTNDQTTWGNVSVNADTYGGVPRADFTVGLDDGTAPYMIVSKEEDGSYSGVWYASHDEYLQGIGNPWGSVLDPEDITETTSNWTGDLQASPGTLVGSLSLESGEYDTVFYPGEHFDYTCTGQWSRLSDSATAIVVFDGEVANIDLLDYSGDLISDESFIAETTAEHPTFTGLGWHDYRGVLFNDRSMIHIRLEEEYEFVSAMLLQRSDQQSQLNGRWASGSRQREGKTAHRGASYIVEYEDSLYVHWVQDADATKTYRAQLDGQLYVSYNDDWQGELSEDGNRIVGEVSSWISSDQAITGWYKSLDRTVQPQEGELNGQWTSIAHNWVHDDSLPGDPVSDYGAAVITQEGDILRITDTYPDGSVYEVQATWMGDHYRGLWWNQDTPQHTYYWTGELLALGWYLHGTWDEGEYSFANLELAEPELQTELEDGALAIVADPYEDVVAMIRDSQQDIAVTIRREQSQLQSLDFVDDQGTGGIIADERWRPTRVYGAGEVWDIVWLDDNGNVEVTITDSTTDEVIGGASGTVDFSDAALLAVIETEEQDTGRDLSSFKDWLEENPGRIEALFSGVERAPALSVIQHSEGERQLAFSDPSASMLADVGAILGIGALGLKAIAMAAGASGLLASGALFAASVVLLFLTAYMFARWLEDRWNCGECSLSCFLRCIF